MKIISIENYIKSYLRKTTDVIAFINVGEHFSQFNIAYLLTDILIHLLIFDGQGSSFQFH